MRFGTLHCIRPIWLVLLICLATGCWQEIEYRGPDPSVAAPSAPPPQVVASTEDSSQTAEVTKPVEPPIASEPIDTAANSAEVGDRYVVTTPDVSDRVVEPEAESPAVTAESSTTRAAQPASEAMSASAEAIPASATTEAGIAPPTINARQAAWFLGSRLSLAALANDRGIAAEDVPKWFAQARSIAEKLGVTLGELPARPAEAAESGPSREVLAYLLDQGKAINGKLAAQDPETAALFQMAWTSNLLLVMNQPGSPQVNYVAKLVGEAAQRTQLPAALWQPLLDTLASGATPATVRTAVRQMHYDIERHLAAAVEP